MEVAGQATASTRLKSASSPTVKPGSRESERMTSPRQLEQFYVTTKGKPNGANGF
ncbi:hypothetical protein ZHAS_00011335 [Anopheles sinensis]|uniref:Uncharacterized protein n=1 Tax=Anopheles sinensis TaxID=74873 RepID=A0A084VZY3_ANOSI|nr:hypothetical protein ZHAS_00011335 [Anopheles sinensis]